MRRGILGIAATTAAVLSGIAFATPSSASDPGDPGYPWDHVWTSYDNVHGATVYAEENGDFIRLCDTAADGYSAHVDIDYGYQWEGVWVDRGSFSLVVGGNGSCVQSNFEIHNIPEGDTVKLSIYTSDSFFPHRDTWFVNDH